MIKDFNVVRVRTWVRVWVRVTLIAMTMLPFIKQSIESFRNTIHCCQFLETNITTMLYHIKTFIFLKTKVQFSLNFDINFDKVLNMLNIHIDF